MNITQVKWEWEGEGGLSHFVCVDTTRGRFAGRVSEHRVIQCENWIGMSKLERIAHAVDVWVPVPRWMIPWRVM